VDGSGGSDPEGDADGLAEGDDDGLADGEALALGDALALGEALAFGEALALGEGLTLGEALALGEGAGPSETSRTTRAVCVAPARLKAMSTVTLCPAMAGVMVSWQVAQPSPPLAPPHDALPPGKVAVAVIGAPLMPFPASVSQPAIATAAPTPGALSLVLALVARPCGRCGKGGWGSVAQFLLSSSHCTTAHSACANQPRAAPTDAQSGQFCPTVAPGGAPT
jgi:hypothetical protein